MRNPSISPNALTLAAVALISLGSYLPHITAQSATQETLDIITEDVIAAPLDFLSHDLLEGRGVATRGDRLSRLYLRTQFKLFGLEPAGPDGKWEQSVPIVGITAKVVQPLAASGPNGQKVFTAPGDYTAFAAQPLASTAWSKAPLVFVGYGINAPEQNWNDFKDVDVKGKVLLVMNNDPSDDPELFAGKTRLYYGRWSYKYEEAARRGALGAIVIHTTPSAGYPFQVIQAGQGRERFWLPFEEGQPTIAIRSWCSEDAARSLCALGGKDLDKLRTMAETRAFRPVELGVTVDLATENTVRKLESGNVIARLPGSDPNLKDEVVVVTAHFDHLGVGREVRGDKIYNGALDNASGSAAMLAIAKACAQSKHRPKRSLLFTAVTAEESGLLGSKYFAFNPTIAKKKIVANFNIDGINIWGPTKDLAMIGYGKNSLTEVAKGIAAKHGRNLVANPEVDKGLFYRSDHFSFARIGVPSAYFKAGNDFLERGAVKRRVKLSYTGTRYHQPSDQFDSRWNLKGAVADTKVILDCLISVANNPEPPKWAPGDEFEKLR